MILAVNNKRNVSQGSPLKVKLVKSASRDKEVFASDGIETIVTDIMALTKLNYNACKFASGLPVTL